MVQIIVGIGERGVERISAVGKTGADRAETLSVLSRLEPAFDLIDRKMQLPPDGQVSSFSEQT